MDWLSVLTLHPEFFNPPLEGGWLEADTETCQNEEANEDDFSGVGLDEATHLEQLRLNLRPEP